MVIFFVVLRLQLLHWSDRTVFRVKKVRVWRDSFATHHTILVTNRAGIWIGSFQTLKSFFFLPWTTFRKKIVQGYSFFSPPTANELKISYKETSRLVAKSLQKFSKVKSLVETSLYCSQNICYIRKPRTFTALESLQNHILLTLLWELAGFRQGPALSLRGRAHPTQIVSGWAANESELQARCQTSQAHVHIHSGWWNI